MSIQGAPFNDPSVSDLAGGVPVAGNGAPAGALVDGIGQLQFGPVLFGGTSRAGWVDLQGWRSLPGADIADTDKPQGHGAYAGTVYGQSLVVTFTYLVTGLPDAKQAALRVIEANTRLGVEQPLVVNDGDGAWRRTARVIAREVPQGKHYRHGPVECAVQFLCADPRMYSLQPASSVLTLGSSVGGLDYPLAYPLDYGTYVTAGGNVINDGSEDTPLQVTFRGPLTNPVLRSDNFLLEFDINLASGETLTVDADQGTVLLNGQTDRLNTISSRSDPPEACNLPPGPTELTLAAAAGTGTALVAFSHARL